MISLSEVVLLLLMRNWFIVWQISGEMRPGGEELWEPPEAVPFRQKF
jgi:hypothetical protein